MPGHEYFEELSALAAVGELSGEELSLLDEHVHQCESCRAAGGEFSQIVHDELPHLHRDFTPLWERLRHPFPSKTREQRFVARARGAGFRFSEAIEGKPAIARLIPSFRVGYALAPSLLLILAAIPLTILEFQKSRSLSTNATDLQHQVSSLTRENDRLSRQIDSDAKTIAALESRSAEARGDLKASNERIAAAERDRDKNAVEGQRLKAALEAEETKSASLSTRLQANAHSLAELSNEVQGLKSNHTADAVIIASQQKQLDEVSQQLKAQNEVLSREQQLLSAGRDIRELMGARNLHIIDVFDTDPKGSNRRAFGRVFFTEGTSLIFYAFDLSSRSILNVKHSFQAWGLRDGVNESTRSLGIFYVDDATQKRWVLRVEDPKMLEQIDSVFVTVEPFGGAEKPSGHKLLYAFLKNQANHP